MRLTVGQRHQIAAGAFTVDELLARPDAAATIARLDASISDANIDRDLAVTLTALAVLRARAATEAQL